MIVACRGCAYRFEALGYRDAQCPVCDEVTPTVRACPACSKPLVVHRISDVVVDACEACHGMFIDSSAIHLVLAKGQEARARAIIEAVAKSATPTITPAPGAGRSCPTCGAAMTRTLSSDGSGVVLDVCKPHGTFFDGDELQKIVAYAEGQAKRYARYDSPAVRAEPGPETSSEDKPRDQPTPGEVMAGVLLVGGMILIRLLLGI